MSFVNPLRTNETFKYPFVSVVALAVLAWMLSLSGVSGAFSQPPPGESLTLAWDEPHDPNIASHRIYVGMASGQLNLYGETGGDSTFSFIIEGLQRGSTYYFAVSAVNNAGLESPRSDELSIVIDTPPLPTGSNLAKSPGGGYSLQWSFPVSHLTSSPEFFVHRSTDLVKWTVVDVVGAYDFTAWDSNSVGFTWPIPANGGTAFFRLSARNWLGDSAGP